MTGTEMVVVWAAFIIIGISLIYVLHQISRLFDLVDRLDRCCADAWMSLGFKKKGDLQ